MGSRLSIILVLASGCIWAQEPQGCALAPNEASVQSKRLAQFDSLFLTNAPLHYDNCHTYLFWLDYEAILDTKEKHLVCLKLRKFLSRKTARPLDPNSGMTGVAPPEAVLRQYAVRLLGKLGTREDIPFLEGFSRMDESKLPWGLRYGWKTTTCAEALNKIKERESANKPKQAMSQ